MEAFLEMLEKAKKYFNQYGLGFPTPNDTLYAWNLSKAAALAADGGKAGYFSEEEVYSSMLEAGALANLYYSSWEEYAAAFVLGNFFDRFFGENEVEMAELAADKDRVRYMRNFLADKEFMECPFQVDGRQSLPAHYQPQQQKV